MNVRTSRYVIGCAVALLVILAALAVGLGIGIAVDRLVLARSLPLGIIPKDAQASFRLMAEAWNVIHDSYVDREAVVSDALTYGAISGMVDALGDTGHSRFLSPEAVKQEEQFNRGEFEGIGAYIEMKDGRVVIVAPIDGSPAQRAGLRPGDIILRVDGQDLAGYTLEQARARILGPAGTQVTLVIQNPDTGEEREVTLTRAVIKLDNVTWQRLPGTDVAHVRLVSFSEGVTRDLIDSLQEMRLQGIQAIILDLRSNPGGLLPEAVGTASQFLDHGNVLLQRDARGNDTPVPVNEGGVAPDLPMVVLIDMGTASASEIVAGALQDAQRALLVGETTFGTGTVLNQFPLSDGSALLLATSQWLTPSGRVIWHKGIEPDVPVELAPGADMLIPEEEGGLTEEELRNSTDAQLLKALDILQGSTATWIEYRRTGGIAGLDDRLTIDDTGAAALERGTERVPFQVDRLTMAKLEQQLQQAAFAQLDSEYLPDDTCCDLFEYWITVQGHTVHTMDTAIPAALQPVLATLTLIIESHRIP